MYFNRVLFAVLLFCQLELATSADGLIIGGWDLSGGTTTTGESICDSPEFSCKIVTSDSGFKQIQVTTSDQAYAGTIVTDVDSHGFIENSEDGFKSIEPSFQASKEFTAKSWQASSTNGDSICSDATKKVSFIPNPNNNTVEVINRCNKASLRTISVGEEPFSVVDNVSEQNVYVLNRKSQTISIIDKENLDLIDSIELDATPSDLISLKPFVVVVSYSDSTAISLIDTSSDDSRSYELEYAPDKMLFSSPRNEIITFSKENNIISFLSIDANHELELIHIPFNQSQIEDICLGPYRLTLYLLTSDIEDSENFDIKFQPGVGSISTDELTAVLDTIDPQVPSFTLRSENIIFSTSLSGHEEVVVAYLDLYALNIPEFTLEENDQALVSTNNHAHDYDILLLKPEEASALYINSTSKIYNHIPFDDLSESSKDEESKSSSKAGLSSDFIAICSLLLFALRSSHYRRKQ